MELNQRYMQQKTPWDLHSDMEAFVHDSVPLPPLDSLPISVFHFCQYIV